MIRNALQERHVVRVDELAATLQVSPATVRRDLTEMDRIGLLRKVHGGAVWLGGRLEEPLFEDKTNLAAGEKRAIAAAAAEYIKDNDAIYLDGGSTVLALAQLIAERASLTVVTNSLRVAATLSGRGPRLIVIGGELRRLSQTFVGTLTEPMIHRLHLDKAFMGTMGFSIEGGLTTTEPAEAFTKQLVMRRAEQVILLADSSKFGKIAFAHAGDLKTIDVLITDSGLSEQTAESLEKQALTVIRAD